MTGPIGHPASGNNGTGGGVATANGLGLVTARPLVQRSPTLRFPLSMADTVRVAPGQTISAGVLLADRLRNPRVEETGRRRREEAGDSPLLSAGQRTWLLSGGQREPLESPTSGIVRSADTATGLVVEAAADSLAGVLAIGGPSRGRLEVATGADGELRPAALDVGRSGSILVVGSRVEAETLTRARAMGVRGVVVAALSGKDLRDFEASERRQRASVHQLAPFAVLVLDGVLRRPIASPVMELLASLEGTEVAIVGDPPQLLFRRVESVPTPPADWVRVASGPMAGREGRWAGPAGPRRFGAAVHLEAGFVRFDDGPATPVPLADLERFV
jgi:hypothetical protein